MACAGLIAATVRRTADVSEAAYLVVMRTAIAVVVLLVPFYAMAACIAVGVKGKRKAPAWALFLFAYGARIGAVWAAFAGLFFVLSDAWLVSVLLFLQAAFVWYAAGHE